MSKKNRFLLGAYVFNTLIIKSKAFMLKMTRGSYPFDYFKNKTSIVDLEDYKLNYSKNYHSLKYLNYEKALVLHSGERSVTQELILGLVYYNDLLKDKIDDHSKIIETANVLRAKADVKDDLMIFYIDETYDRFDLKGKYFSGIVQGKAASFFLRCHDISNDNKYKDWARQCLLSAKIDIANGGVSRSVGQDQYWVEEYPSPNPSMVLNGFLFYIIGLVEYLTFEEDEEIRSLLQMSLQTAISWIPNYKLSNGLLYSMYRWNLCNVHYTGIMKFQFEHLYKLTGIQLFKEFGEFADGLTDWKTFDKIV